MYLVEEPCFEALLHDARGTHADVVVACDRLCLLYGAFESVRDERERRSFVDPVLWDASELVETISPLWHDTANKYAIVDNWTRDTSYSVAGDPTSVVTNPGSGQTAQTTESN